MLQVVVVWYRLVRGLAGGIREDPEFRALATAGILLLLSGTVFYSLQEGWSALDALYFSTVVLTTVGLGDLAPVTALGKLFTIGYVLSGVGVILGLVDRRARR